MGTTAKVAVLPTCQFGDMSHTAHFDFKTWQGPWAYGCTSHYEANRAYEDLGTGKGQRLEGPTEEEVAKS